MAATDAIPERRVLAIVVVEVQVMNGMAGCSIDDRVVGEVLSVMDEDGPKDDKYEEHEERKLVHREYERKYVIREGLCPTIRGVEGIRSKRGRYHPLVMLLVESLVYERMVQASMNPINAEIGEEEEQGELQDVVPQSRSIGRSIIHLGVSASFGKDQGKSEERHARKRHESLLDLHSNLIFEIFGMLLLLFVEYEKV